MSGSEASGSFNVDRSVRRRVVDRANRNVVPRPEGRAGARRETGGHAAPAVTRVTPKGRVVRVGLDVAWLAGVVVAVASLLFGGCATAGGAGGRACSTWDAARAAACGICALPSCGDAAEVGTEGEGDVFAAPSPPLEIGAEPDIEAFRAAAAAFAALAARLNYQQPWPPVGASSFPQIESATGGNSGPTATVTVVFPVGTDLSPFEAFLETPSNWLVVRNDTSAPWSPQTATVTGNQVALVSVAEQLAETESTVSIPAWSTSAIFTPGA